MLITDRYRACRGMPAEKKRTKLNTQAPIMLTGSCLYHLWIWAWAVGPGLKGHFRQVARLGPRTLELRLKSAASPIWVGNTGLSQVRGLARESRGSGASTIGMEVSRSRVSRGDLRRVHNKGQVPSCGGVGIATSCSLINFTKFKLPPKFSGACGNSSMSNICDWRNVILRGPDVHTRN